jgi:pimeloyl-ACP methyl ester carboxylesterase
VNLAQARQHCSCKCVATLVPSKRHPYNALFRVTISDDLKSSLKVDLKALGPDFAIPIFVFEGPDDYIRSPELAKAYVDAINAPQKDFLLLPVGGHFAVFTHSEDFLKEMNSRVRPLALRSPQVQSELE